MMNMKYGIVAGAILLILLCMGIAAAEDTSSQDSSDSVVVDGVPAYDGPLGPDSPLYGLKIAWEDLDESFTANETELTEKQMTHARLRLSEVRRELAENRTGSAQQALDLYWQKMNLTQTRIDYFSSNATGLLHAQEMHTKHQLVLEDLLLAHPNNTGLARAYNNSLKLEEKFQEKTQVRFDTIIGKENKTIMKAYRLEVQEDSRNGKGSGLRNETQEQERTQDKVHVQDTQIPDNSHRNTNANSVTGNDGKGNGNGDGKGSASGAQVQVTNVQPSESPTQYPQGGGMNGNGNADDKGKGNGHSK